MNRNALIRKYNVPGPRYTSYPTVPCWDQQEVQMADWHRLVTAVENEDAANGISLYIHLPYCDSLCTYCGCNTRITVNHAVEQPYVEAVIQEWRLYRSLLGKRPLIREIHLGGGTPTFFSAQNLKFLITEILKGCAVHPEHEFGFEGHPNNTTRLHLQTLYDLGFRRVSFGIQDFDPKVQEIVNRIQPVEKVKECTAIAREIGYTSVNYDLIYGLPLQTLESVKGTIDEVKKLRPDRIAFYSYAHVPWVKPGQRKFTERDLPEDEVKRDLYETGKRLLEEAGYLEIGMDHFALPEDPLARAFTQKNMHRNFMGYTTTNTKLLIGLGVSAISDAWGGFVQNLKKVEDYLNAVKEGRLPYFKGHILNAEDLIMRSHILSLMCTFETTWKSGDVDFHGEIIERLTDLQTDGLVEINSSGVRITNYGMPFVRNVCMAFDLRLWAQHSEKQLFSKTV
jgi:oxygen-independent coproporphyrinogen III oxidase